MKAIRRIGFGAIALGLLLAGGKISERSKGSAIAHAYGLSFDLPAPAAYWQGFDSRPLLASQLYKIEAGYFAMPQSASAIESFLGLPSSVSFDGVAYWNIANADGSIASEQLAIGFSNGRYPSAYGSWRVYRYAG